MEVLKLTVILIIKYVQSPTGMILICDLLKFMALLNYLHTQNQYFQLFALSDYNVLLQQFVFIIFRAAHCQNYRLELLKPFCLEFQFYFTKQMICKENLHSLCQQGKYRRASDPLLALPDLTRPAVNIYVSTYIFTILGQGIWKMLKMLEQYIISERPSGQLDKLAETNERLQQKISHLEHKISSFDSTNLVDSYHQCHSPHNSYSRQETSQNSQLQSLKQIFETDQHKIKEELAIIESQQQQVELFQKYIDIYLQETVNEPRALQDKIKALQQLTKQSEQTPRQHQVLQRWTSSLLQKLNRRLYSLVTVYPNNCIKIQIEHMRQFSDLLNEETCREFIKCIYRNCIVYDVPTQSYVLKKPVKIIEAVDVIIIHLECEVFKREQAQSHYQHLFDSISSFNSISHKILGLLQESQQGESPFNLESVINSEIKDSQADLKSIIEYILPYLHLENRKQLLNILSSQDHNPTIYDLLVKLMIAGQDAEFMSHTVSSIVAKVKEDISALDDLYVFLSINLQAANHRAYNIAFYVCDQLINQLENFVDYGWVSRLLEMRENFRFKIHHPPN